MTIDEMMAKEKANAEKLRKIIETGYDGGISIEAIFCDDTAAIKEAYERFENCAKEHEQLAEWLEELKFRRVLQLQCEKEFFAGYEKGKKEGYNKGYADGSLSVTSEIRNKTIDDYMNKLCNHCMQQTNECYKLECPFCTDGCDIVGIAEQLKAGGENENEQSI